MLESRCNSNSPLASKKKTTKAYDIARTPIVAVMGHVDHGKTSLLDAIRETDVAAGEAGGITQNTRAHQIDYNGQKITFIDTPGHEAFSAMRSRGAKVTDLVLLVVAADDGVQPQTKESIKFAKESGVPVIVAINKIDLPGKNLNKLKQELSSAGLELEEYGGEVIVNEVSAIKKTGLTELLDSVLLTAELNELKKDAAPEGVEGTAFVLESVLDENLGPVSLVLVKSGGFSTANFVVHENGYSKIRTLLDNDTHSQRDGAEQGDPVAIVGLKDILPTGSYINIVKDERTAKKLYREIEEGERDLLEAEQTDEPAAPDNDLAFLADLLADAKTEKEIKYLNVVLRTDSQGTLEVATEELSQLNDEEVQIKLIDSGVGAVTEKDVQAAKAARAIILGFQVETPRKVAELAKKERVLVRTYEVIYEMIEEISDAMDSMADPVLEKVEVARARVKQVFVLSNGAVVAGSEVIKGTVIKGYRIYIERDGAEMAEAKITELRQNKNVVKEIKKGQDCGILFEPKYDDLQEGDEIVCFKVEKL
ncbi:MAG: Translation initiation factor IF-2 [candidate division WS6 bacterium OLB20]|uniref:Translation initiation factor IF-2 n=1 Tax=candidate division WS6 bacterium OLB20 TaxID=1617426 RepID=A0A136LZ88_9BACT|nr:MAG: Translation initiation factor IF-2 [candidate division WS6 bacterium OLB20]